MKKLFFILLLSGQLMAQSPVTITGLYKSCLVKKSEYGWDVSRNAGEGSANIANSEYGTIRVDRYIYSYIILYRVGLIFDVTTVPYGSVIDSVFLKLYVTNSEAYDDLGLVVYDAYTIKCEADYLTDYSHVVGVVTGTNTPNFQIMDYKESISTGYQTFKLSGLRMSLWYGNNYVCYGLGSYHWDYLDHQPLGINNNITINLFTVTDKPELKIYYHSQTSTPKKIKIITIF